MLDQAKADLEGAQREAQMASTYKKEIDELSVYLQEYQAKANNKVRECFIIIRLVTLRCHRRAEYCSRLYGLSEYWLIIVYVQIATLQANLSKAEAEVKHLDAELMRMLHKVA